MKPTITSVAELLAQSDERQFKPVLETESLAVACQKFNGEHKFRHLNKDHDEVLYVIKGELKVWTSEGELHLKAGDIMKIPKAVEHGDLYGFDVEILIMEGI